MSGRAPALPLQPAVRQGLLLHLVQEYRQVSYSTVITAETRCSNMMEKTAEKLHQADNSLRQYDGGHAAPGPAFREA